MAHFVSQSVFCNGVAVAVGDHTCQQHAMLSFQAVDGGMYGFIMAGTLCFTGRGALKES